VHSKRTMSALALIALLAATLVLCGSGCPGGGSNPDDADQTRSGEAYSQPDGTVTIDLGPLGTFVAMFCDPNGGAPMNNVKCVVAANPNKTDVVYAGVASHTKMPRLVTRPKSEVLGAPGMQPPGCDDVFDWIGGADPITGVHGAFPMPGWAWEEIGGSKQDIIDEMVEDMEDGNIRDELAQLLPGPVLVVVHPAGSDDALVYTAHGKVATVGQLLTHLKASVFGPHGYCDDQQIRLSILKGIPGGDVSLALPLLEPVVRTPGCEGTDPPGEIFGNIRNANTAAPVEGATVLIGGAAGTSDASGDYTVSGILPGEELPVTATAANYVPYAATLDVASGSSTQHEIVLAPFVEGEQFRFVVTWGEEPRDLDSHMWVPISQGSYTHVYYGSKGSFVSAPYCTLDVDDTSSYGPETITVLPEYSGEYIYAVREFSGEGTIATSDAVVQIFDGNTLMHTMGVPSGSPGDGWYWYVGTLNAQTGVLTIDNTYHAGPPVALREPMAAKE